MCKGLIGYTGFVGSNISEQINFDFKYNSLNIGDIRGKEFDLIVCAGAPGVKWKANKFPEDDLASINSLIENLAQVKSKKFILISTVDVYNSPINVTEDTAIYINKLQPYGKHRLLLEEFVTSHFNDYLIVRLPGLFGTGLKKNFIYDLLSNNCLELIDCESEFQFYNLNNIWKDIKIALANNLRLLNISTEPVKCKDIAFKSLGIEFTNKTDKIPVKYNMKSKYTKLFGKDGGYIYTKDETYKEIKEFVDWARKGGK